MIGLLCFVLTVLAAPFKSKCRLEAENAALRHQLIVLRRKVQGGVRLTTTTAGSLSNCIDGSRRHTADDVSKMVHAALLLLMLEAVTADLVSPSA